MTCVAAGIQISRSAYGFPSPIDLIRDFSPDPFSTTGTTESGFYSDECGYSGADPNHFVTLTDEFSSLRVYVSSPQDLTLRIQGRGVDFCSDDNPDEGWIPSISRSWSAGEYRVWVGDWDADSNHSYSLIFTEGGGYPIQNSVFGTIDLVGFFEPNPYTVESLSGGNISTSNCGYIWDEPDHILNLHSDFLNLTISAKSEEKVTLLVRGPRGDFCSPQNASVSGSWPAGQYKIWVGDWDDGRYDTVLQLTRSATR
ncbi:MAG: hypothetical protein AAF728_06825 [Cyanobacteria bacterium P01_D01_bin.128]